MQVHNVLSARAGGALHSNNQALGPFITVSFHVEAMRQAWLPGQDPALAESRVVNEELGAMYFDNLEDAPAIIDSLILDLSRLRTRLQLEMAELPKPELTPTEGVNADGDPIPF
jgi:hypothetical protein